MGNAFVKPQNLKYTDMAIYIDAHVKDIVNPGENPEIENLIYEYLYHIFFALSCKAHYFKKMEDYDQYSLYAATQVYVTLRDRKQNEGEFKRDKVVAPIKSSLNYVKTLLYPLKVNYQQANFLTKFNPEENTKQDTAILMNDLQESVRSDYSYGLSEAYQNAMSYIPQMIKEVIATTPFKNDPVMSKKLLCSCLLTLSNQITLSANARNLVDKSGKEEAFTKQFTLNEKKFGKILLWHLPQGFESYISILIARAKRSIGKALESTKTDFYLPDDVVNDILASAYATYDASNGLED